MYQQERDLFGFFCSSTSTVETAIFALFHIGAFLAPARFPIGTPMNEKKITLPNTKTAMRMAFPGDPILAVIDNLVADQPYIDLCAVRNILTHRGAPSREHFADISEGASNVTPQTRLSKWQANSADISPNMLSSERLAIVATITGLLAGIRIFTEARL
jgi:hypothetical protein